MRQPFRVAPAMPAQDYKTYAFGIPAARMRPATCAEVGCGDWRNGWSTTIDTGTDLGAVQANYIVNQSGRRFASAALPGAPSMVRFTFPPGQRCFRSDAHKQVDGDPVYTVRRGDWRGDPTRSETLVHSGPDSWVNDFATHQEKLITVLEGK